MKQYLYPKKTIKCENVDNVGALFVKRDLQVDLFETDIALTDKKGGYLILDFGKEVRGGIRILTVSLNGGKSACVRIRFGESVTECCSELGEKNSTNDHSPRDFNFPLVFASDVTVGDTGFRFVRIDFPCGVSVGLKSVIAVNEILRLPLENRYEGNDTLVRKIFDTAKRTVDLCSSGDYIWDGIKRDRLVWSGDLYPEILSLTYLYGRVKQIENTIDFECAHAKFEGKWISMITTYSLWWVACVAEYYFRTKTKDFTLKQIPYMKEILSQIDDCVSNDGAMRYPEHFVDWATRDTADEELGSRLISIFAVKKAILLLKEFGIPTQNAENLLKKLLKADFAVKEKKQVIAFKYFALDEISDDEYGRLIEGGAKGFSTYMSYFILTAIASRDKKLAVSLMKEYYGGMLDKGATTFWEDFDVDWIQGSGRIDGFPKDGEKDIHGDYGRFCYRGFRHSLCHAWSSGVINFIAENCE